MIRVLYQSEFFLANVEFEFLFCFEMCFDFICIQIHGDVVFYKKHSFIMFHMFNSSQDILFIALSIGVIWITVMLCWLLYQAARFLKNANDIIENVSKKIELMSTAIDFIKTKIDGMAKNMGVVSGLISKIVEKMVAHSFEKKLKDEGKEK